ncbi:MAG TPA: sulfur reduction protein DsrE, partial [Thermodesulfatator sp.]|nr:sulfur reduction protein DsrE [Thermodesulfatator sp.]
TAWQALRIANFALSKGDQVTIFLLGKGVTISEIDSDEFDIDEKLESFLDEGGRLIACGTAMKMHQISPSELCPRGGRKDLYRLIWSSDKVLTF